MKNLKILFLVLLVISASALVNAALTDNLLAYWNLNEASGTNIADSVNAYNATSVGTVDIISGLIGNARNFTNGARTQYFQAANGLIQNRNTMSICYWMKHPLASHNGEYVIDYRRDNNGLFHGHETATGIFAKSGGNVWNTGLRFVLDNNYHFYCYVFNQTSDWFYIDTVLNASSLNHAARTMDNTAAATYFSAGQINSAVLASFDEIGWWNRALTAAEIQILYNGGTGLTYPFLVGTVTVGIIKPLNISYSTSSMVFNVSANSTIGISSCWFNIGGGNNTMTNATVDTWQYTNSSIPDGGYYMTAFCNNTASAVATTNVTFTIHTVPPNITAYTCSAPTPVDNTDPYYTSGNQTPCFNFTIDENAWCNVSKDNSTWYSEVSGGGTTAHKICLNSTLQTNLGTDLHYLNCSDAAGNRMTKKYNTYTSFLKGIYSLNGVGIPNSLIGIYYNESTIMQYNGTTNSSGHFMIGAGNHTYTVCAMYAMQNISIRGICSHNISVVYGNP